MHFFRLVFFKIFLLLVFANQLNGFSQTYFNGYHKSIDGDEIAYHAPDPRATWALLVRSQDSLKSIQWESEAIPSHFKGEAASFVWLYGMDAAAEQHEFILSANGRELLRFSNPKVAQKKDVIVQGKHGASVRFRTTKIDRHKDVMGYAICTLPADLIVPGESVRFQVRGKSAGSDIWYMTFQYEMKREVVVKPQNLIINHDGKHQQSVRIEVVNLDAPKQVSVRLEDGQNETYRVEPGYNALQYFVPETAEKKQISVYLKIGEEEEISKSISIEPVRPWTIYLVQHTHTDIGYTRPQSEILPEHLRFIDYALDYCDLTDNYPDDARFRWTCESAWAVEQYLQRRPESQVRRLLRRIEEGRIEIAAMLFNMSEIADETSLTRLLDPIKLFQERGIEVKTAMQDDVNGIGWCMADYLPDVGVDYLIMGEHGHRALIPFDMPTAFWWESPSGKKMLAFRGEHYMHGNALLLHTGEMDNFRSNLMNYLGMLEYNDYPFDHLALQYSGYVTDNSPPALTANKVIKAWNEQYVWPKLRSATASEFMEYVESSHGDELETYRKAWPDWWTDGFGSAARETAAAREAQEQMTITSGLLAMAAGFGEKIESRVHQSLYQIYRNILFYDEHTFGAAESISQPTSENSMAQWAEKSSYVYEALKQSRILREEAFGLLQQHIPRYDSPSITVFNTLNKARSGPVEVYIDHEIVDPGTPFSITDKNGTLVKFQSLSSRSDGTYWVLWVDNVPPMGYKSLIIQNETGKKPETTVGQLPFKGNFENAYWSVAIDTTTGGLNSLFDKQQDKELVDSKSSWKPGQLIYERLTNRRQLEMFTLREEPERTTLTDITIGAPEVGPIWTSISILGQLAGCSKGPVQLEYRFYNTTPVIELIYSLDKLPITDPEALYVAFPFLPDDAEIIFEAQGGSVRPGKDQLAGTSSDWNTVQNYVTLRSDEGQVIVVSPEIPLFHLGGLNLGNFSYDHQPESQHIFSWVMNNYWTTNFRASQEGTFTWRYYITSAGEQDLSKATDFGWESRLPLIGRVFPEASTSTEGGLPEGLIATEIPGLLMVNAAPAEEDHGIVFHFREVDGKTVNFDPGSFFIRQSDCQWTEVNAIGKPIANISGTFDFQPYSVHFLKVTWEP